MSDRTSARNDACRLAAIDVGTNSIRLIVAETLADGGYRLVDDEKEVCRLGRGLAKSDELSERAMIDSALVIARMKGIAEGYGVRALRAVATCAVREAENRHAFIELVEREAGISLEIISAEEEAKLAYLSVAHAFDLRGVASAIVDIGGGSTEIILSSGGVIEHVWTLPLGAVRLTEQLGLGPEPDRQAYRRMRKWINRTMKRTIGKPPFVPQMLFGTGGTFTTLAGISIHRGRADETDLLPFTVRGYEMQRSEVKHLVDRLRKMPLRVRTRVAGLSPDRAEIIVAGAAIVERIMRRLGTNRLCVHDRGIRDGLLLTMIQEMFPRAGAPGGVAPQPPDRMRAVRQFAQACRYEQQHSEHVAHLSLQLFDQLAAQVPGAPGPGGWSDPANRQLLEAAAVLHDIGYYINYSRHHKHSYHLIIHSELAGFTHRELQVIANVARYHRCALPKKKHANFRELDQRERRLVRRLAAILRVADGLDRAHAQEVGALALRVRGGEARVILDLEERPDIGIWGAQRKARLFEQAFGLNLRFSLEAAPAGDGTEQSALESPSDLGGRIAGRFRSHSGELLPHGLEHPAPLRQT